jgi:hypothetical protein
MIKKIQSPALFRFLAAVSPSANLHCFQMKHEHFFQSLSCCSQVRLTDDSSLNNDGFPLVHLAGLVRRIVFGIRLIDGIVLW